MGITAIVKATHNCNFACPYCYIDDHAENGFMSPGTLENVIDQVMYVNKLRNSGSEFIWHGGEPLLAGIDFYQRVVDLQKKHLYELNHVYQDPANKNIQVHSEKVPIRNCIQSNGSLLDDKYIEFCKLNNFNVGFSLDGPREVNKLTRVAKDNSETYEDTLNAINKAREAKIGGGIITVLTKKNIDSIPELYNFYKENGLDAKVNPLIKSGNAIQNYEDLSITPKQYGDALIHLFDLWYFDQNASIQIDPLNEIIGNLIYKTTKGCNFGKSCQSSFVSIGPQGDVYPCGRFDGVSGFKLGNINSDSLNDILGSKWHQTLIDGRTSRVKEICGSCDYIKICSGGCMHNAFMASGNVFSKDYYCKSYRMIFDHISKSIAPELAKARRIPNEDDKTIPQRREKDEF